MTEFYQSPPPAEVLKSGFDLEFAIRETTEKGYFLGSDVILKSILLSFESEINLLPMELGNHVDNPIYAGTKKEIKQLHDRFYTDIYNPEVAIASMVVESVASQVNQLSGIDPSLASWLPNEVGYQRYHQSEGHITPHRDRRNDQILAFTITIAGSNIIRIHEPLGDPDDYENLRQVDEFRTSPGSVMFLRAPGLGTGEQVIHSVLPPEDGSRLILNLRMRPDILRPPSEFI